MLDDDYGPICRRRDVWAFTEYTKPRYSSRKDTTTDADINRLMKATFPDRKFVSSLSAEVRAAARARLLNEGPISDDARGDVLRGLLSLKNDAE